MRRMARDMGNHNPKPQILNPTYPYYSKESFEEIAEAPLEKPLDFQVRGEGGFRVWGLGLRGLGFGPGIWSFGLTGFSGGQQAAGYGCLGYESLFNLCQFHATGIAAPLAEGERRGC